MHDLNRDAVIKGEVLLDGENIYGDNMSLDQTKGRDGISEADAISHDVCF